MTCQRTLVVLQIVAVVLTIVVMGLQIKHFYDTRKATLPGTTPVV